MHVLGNVYEYPCSEHSSFLAMGGKTNCITRVWQQMESWSKIYEASYTSEMHDACMFSSCLGMRSAWVALLALSIYIREVKTIIPICRFCANEGKGVFSDGLLCFLFVVFDPASYLVICSAGRNTGEIDLGSQKNFPHVPFTWRRYHGYTNRVFGCLHWEEPRNQRCKTIFVWLIESRKPGWGERLLGCLR